MRTSALVFACHQASCRPPTSGGTGGSSPAKDPRSSVRFDPERGYSIQAANGVTLRATFSKVHPPYDADPTSDIDDVWGPVAKNALVGLKTAFDLAPTDIVPQIVVGDFSQVKVGKRLTGQETYAFVESGHFDRATERGVIAINASEHTMGKHLEDAKPWIFMPQQHSVSLGEYIAIHEYGHHRQFNGGDWRNLDTLHEKSKESANMSPYGTTNMFESGAEVFAAWVLDGGKAKTALTKRYQKEYKWGEAQSITAAAAERPDSDVQAILETESGPVIIYTDGSSVRYRLKPKSR